MTIELTGINNDDAADSSEVPSSTTRDWRLFNVILLGVTFLLVFTAFQTCSMVQVREALIMCAIYV